MSPRCLTLLVLATTLGGCHDHHCDRHLDCDDDEICHFGTCEFALERYYEVGMDAAWVGPHHPDGLNWDMDGTPPDLFVELTTYDEVCASSTAWDTTQPLWVEYCTLWIPAWPELNVDLWDRDPLVDEFVAGWSWRRPEALVQLARTDGYLFTVSDGTGTVEVDLWVTVP